MKHAVIAVHKCKADVTRMGGTEYEVKERPGFSNSKGRAVVINAGPRDNVLGKAIDVVSGWWVKDDNVGAADA